MAKTDEELYKLASRNGYDDSYASIFIDGYRTCEKDKDAEIERLNGSIEKLMNGILREKEEIARLHGIIERAYDRAWGEVQGSDMTMIDILSEANGGKS